MKKMGKVYVKKMVNKKKNLNGVGVHRKIIIILCGIVLVSFILTLSGTYSFFMRTFMQKEHNYYETGMLSINFNSSDDVIVPLMYPLTDGEGMNTEIYSFDIINDGTLSYRFDLKLNDMDRETINCNSDDYIICYLKVQLNDEEPVLLSAINDFVIKSDITVSSNTRVGMKLRVWIDENAPSNLIGKSFNGNLLMDGIAVVTYRGLANQLYTYGDMIQDKTMDKNYRYKGGGCREINFTDDGYERNDCSNINNYVSFNNELWRIVGIFNIDGEQRVKIIRDTYLSEPRYWNSDFEILGYFDNERMEYSTMEECELNGIMPCNPNYSSISSDFGDSTIKDYLNGNGEDDYYYSLTNDAKSLIQLTNWNVGGVDLNIMNTLEQLYKAERNTNYYECIDSDHDGFDDNNGIKMSEVTICGSVTSVYEMAVGLMYPSDYLFASTNNCDNDVMLMDCQKDNWLNKYNKMEYLMAPAWELAEFRTIKANSMVLISGEINSLNANSLLYLRPSVYLRKSVLITSGNGSITSPYILKLDTIS